MSPEDRAAAILTAVQTLAEWHSTFGPIPIQTLQRAIWMESVGQGDRGPELIGRHVPTLRALAEQLPRIIDLIDDALADE